MRNYQCAFLHIITIANKRSTVFGFKSRVRWWRRVLFSFAVCDFVLSWLNCVDFFRTLSLPLPPSRFFSMIFWLYWVTVLFDRTQIRARALQHRWTISNQNNSINAQTISVDRFYNRHLLINLRFLLHFFLFCAPFGSIILRGFAGVYIFNIKVCVFFITQHKNKIHKLIQDNNKYYRKKWNLYAIER